MSNSLEVGSNVSYVLSPADVPEVKQYRAGGIRPATVVSMNGGSGLVNLTVFMDWDNDGTGALIWATSRPYSESLEPGTWHHKADSLRLVEEAGDRETLQESVQKPSNPTGILESLGNIDAILSEAEASDKKPTEQLDEIDALLNDARQEDATQQPA